MKILKRILIALVAVVGLVVVTALVLPFVIDVNRFKGPILKKVDQKINGRVELERISFKIFPFLGLKLEKLAVRNSADSPFAETPVASLSEIDFGVHFKSLLERKIVASLTIRDPEINFIKTAQGSNVDLLMAKGPAEVPPAAPVTPPTGEAASPAVGGGLFSAILIEKILVQNAKLSFEDRITGGPPMTMTDVGIVIDGISLDPVKQVVELKKAELTLKAGTITGHGNLDLTGDQKVFLSLSSTPLDLRALAALSPQAPAKDVEGAISLTFEASGPLKQPTALAFSGTLTSDRIRYEKYTLTKLVSQFAYIGAVADLKGLGFNLWDAQFGGSGKVDLKGAKPVWEMALKVTGLNMDTALREGAGLSDILTGSGNTNTQLTGIGSTKEDLKATLAGSGDLSLENGVFKAANLASGVFSEEIIGALQKAGATPEPIRQLTSAEGTPFGTLTTTFTVEGGKILLSTLKMVNADNQIEMDGTVDLDLQLDLNGKYLLSKEKTASWLQDASTRSLLADDEGRFIAPFRVTGPITRPVVTPDASYVKNLAGRAVKQIVQEKVVPRVKEEAKKQLEGAGEELKKKDVGKELKKLF